MKAYAALFDVYTFLNSRSKKTDFVSQNQLMFRNKPFACEFSDSNAWSAPIQISASYGLASM